MATRESGGVDWTLELERDGLLPGQLAMGRLQLAFRDGISARQLLLTLIPTEHWQYQSTDSDGDSTTVTRREELSRVPVRLLGPTTFAAGETRDIAFELPVPPLGPASLDATVAGLTWELEAKLDIATRSDSAIVTPVRVLQPTALLRAGVVPVGEFALYEAADSEGHDAQGTVEIKPMPLCADRVFDGVLDLDPNGPMKLQEIRFEVRVKAEATVSSGLDEEITLWVGQVLAEGQIDDQPLHLEFRGLLPARDLPTIELPHGTAQAQVHVILAKAWSPDTHLVRDISICTTTEI